MFIQFFIADLLQKFGLSNKQIVSVISVFYLIAYCWLLFFFYKNFHSGWVLLGTTVFLIPFYFLRMRYLKRYLRP